MQPSTGPLLGFSLPTDRPRGRELERQLRARIQDGRLAAGARLPSTRELADDLGVSRGVVVNAYAQLAAEGYLVLRRGTRPVVASVTRPARRARARARDVPIADARFNLRPDLPDLALFPRSDWLKATKAALASAGDADFAYGEPFGAIGLREVLAPFLARTRGVSVRPESLGIATGSSHAISTLGRVLQAQGARRVGIEDPSHRWRRASMASCGLDVVELPVDADGLVTSALDRADVDVVLVSPDHAFPHGVVLSPERRRALLDWVRGGDRLVIEHDFDAHFRYDRPPASALQALAPDRIVYVGTASSLLAPTLRLGWLVLPERLVPAVAGELARSVLASSRIAQHTLAEFIDRGYLDRHLRRARTAYRRRLALARELLPTTGADAGLYVRVPLAPDAAEAAALTLLRTRGFALDGVNQNAVRRQPPALVVGFAASPEPTLDEALRELRRLAEI